MAEVDLKNKSIYWKQKDTASQSPGRVLQERYTKIFGKTYRQPHGWEPFF